MKFFQNKNYFLKTYNYYDYFGIPYLYDSEFFMEYFPNLINYDFVKKFKRKRKVFHRIRKGLTKTEKKNSLKRDINNTIFQQYINIIMKNGNKFNILKNLEKSVEFFFLTLNEENEDFIKYKNYSSLCYLHDNYLDYTDFSYIFENSLPYYFSIFDIKTKKAHKKSRSKKKYIHEITYIPQWKRSKNLLKVINIYSKNFKNYDLWERLFWMFFSVIVDNRKSYLIKRRSYIYKKSIKFFLNKKKI